MLTIRQATTSDAAAVAAIYAPYVTDTVISFELAPPDASEMERRIPNCLASYPWLVATDDRRIAGYVYAGCHSERAAYDWSADITAYLHPDYHRRGLGSRLYHVLIRLLARQGYHALFAGISLPNDASVGIHSALGMREVGIYREVGFKFGRWHDVAWMGMTISEAIPPTTPIPFAQLAWSSEDFIL